MVLCVPCYEQEITNMDVMVTKEKQGKDCARVQNGKQPTIVGDTNQ
jgi:hypothetical protein